MRPGLRFLGRVQRWWGSRRYLEDLVLVFAVVTVVNSAMMVTGWDTPKTGTFTYVHLLSRLAIVAAVVALFHLDDLTVRVQRREGRVRPRRPAMASGRPRRRFARLLGQIERAPLDTVAGTYTAVTTVLCLVGITSSLWREPRGGTALYWGLLVLSAVLALLVGGCTWWQRSQSGAR